MILQLIHHSYHYEMEKLTRSFFPDRTLTVLDDGMPLPADRASEPLIAVEWQEDCASGDAFMQVTFTDPQEGVSECHSEPLQTGPVSSFDTPELAAGRALWSVLSRVTGLTPPWGILTGIRPSKLLGQLTEQAGRALAKDILRTVYLVSPPKIELAETVADAEAEILRSSTPDSFSLYIGIPFCPNRCSYCSFVSQAISTPQAKKLLPDYFLHLLEEVRADADLARKCNLKLRSVYVGGGTPSTLSAEQIAELLKTVRDEFDLSDCAEFTFEAGRPDTLTAEKLQAIHDGGADRISINPQTMSDDVLSAIGRNHTAADIEQSFADARAIGFANINMDLIAGLPGDTPDGFRNSLERVLALQPESVTIHTLAYKRSADLGATAELFSRGRETADMLAYAADRLTASGYAPYYMYRQARSVGNLENVGWCRPGFESPYNVFMMEEKHSIFACGAGAITKLQTPEKRIRRLANYKYPFEYINRFDEILSQKQTILDFYGKESI